MELFTHLIVWGVGLVMGMYIVSQISNHISANTQNKKLLNNLNKLDKDYGITKNKGKG
tara:strand:+ start:576 stop:749 length:174 start_codon:yes stop_codon:yes gene_type:complete